MDCALIHLALSGGPGLDSAIRQLLNQYRHLLTLWVPLLCLRDPRLSACFALGAVERKAKRGIIDILRQHLPRLAKEATDDGQLTAAAWRLVVKDLTGLLRRRLVAQWKDFLRAHRERVCTYVSRVLAFVPEGKRDLRAARRAILREAVRRVPLADILTDSQMTRGLLDKISAEECYPHLLEVFFRRALGRIARALHFGGRPGGGRREDGHGRRAGRQGRADDATPDCEWCEKALDRFRDKLWRWMLYARDRIDAGQQLRLPFSMMVNEAVSDAKKGIARARRRGTTVSENRELNGSEDTDQPGSPTARGRLSETGKASIEVNEPEDYRERPPLAMLVAKESLEELMGQISAREWEILRLHYLEGWSRAEVAEALGCHRATVDRIINLLRERFRDRGDNECR